MKFHQQTGLAKPLARLMLSAPDIARAIRQSHCLIPMPISNLRLQERGYNVPYLLARQLAPRRTRHDILLRVRHTTAQSQLPRKQRLRNLKNAFALNPDTAHQLRRRRIVLLDDVMTTGASVRESAKTLRQAGVSHIAAIVLARVDDEHTT